MIFSKATAVLAIALQSTVHGQEQRSNLPNVPEGFNASARIEIKAPVETVWNAVLDFASYPRWNPFVRSSVLVNDQGYPLPASEQTPKENRTVHLKVQLPPLPMPVSQDTPDVWINTQSANVNITDVLPDRGQIAWVAIDMPEIVLTSKRWSTVLDLGNNVTLYESREVFHGAAVPILKLIMESKLNEGFNAQAKALKVLCETKRGSKR